MMNRSEVKLAEGRRLADQLRALILEGSFGFDQPIPSEAELIVEFGLGRNVVRLALDLLRRDGYVARLQGRGTLVVSQRAIHDLDGKAGISADFCGGGHRVITRFCSVTAEAATPMVAAKLGIEPGAECIVADYETLVDRQPYALATSYLSKGRVNERFSGDMVGDWYGDWVDLLQLLGFSPGRAEIRVEAAAVDAAVASHLRLEPGEPLLRFERLLFDVRGEPLDYGFSRCRSDRLVLQAQAGGCVID